MFPIVLVSTFLLAEWGPAPEKQHHYIGSAHSLHLWQVPFPFPLFIWLLYCFLSCVLFNVPCLCSVIPSFMEQSLFTVFQKPWFIKRAQFVFENPHNFLFAFWVALMRKHYYLKSLFENSFPTFRDLHFKVICFFLSSSLLSLYNLTKILKQPLIVL